MTNPCCEHCSTHTHTLSLSIFLTVHMCVYIQIFPFLSPSLSLTPSSRFPLYTHQWHNTLKICQVTNEKQIRGGLNAIPIQLPFAIVCLAVFLFRDCFDKRVTALVPISLDDYYLERHSRCHCGINNISFMVQRKKKWKNKF